MKNQNEFDQVMKELMQEFDDKPTDKVELYEKLRKIDCPYIKEKLEAHNYADASYYPLFDVKNFN